MVARKRKRRKKSRADVMREVKPGEFMDFWVNAKNTYPSIRGSGYQVFGTSGCRFERISHRMVRMHRI